MADIETIEPLIALNRVHELINFILSAKDIPDGVLAAAVADLPLERRTFIEGQCREWNSKTTVGPGEAAAYADIIRTVFAINFGINEHGADILEFAARVRQLREECVVGTISDMRLPQYGEIPLNMPGQKASGGWRAYRNKYMFLVKS